MNLISSPTAFGETIPVVTQNDPRFKDASTAPTLQIGARAPSTTSMPQMGDDPLPGIGSRLGAYTLTGIIGGGGMGRVYEARDEGLDREAAVKVIAPAIASERSARERIRIEARSAAKLSHPNIVGVYAFGEESGSAYIAMERVRGHSLHALIAADGPMEPRRALTIIRDSAAGLAYAAERGIIHRDIKPANIMIDERGVAKVLDFGLAKDLHSSDPKLTSTNMVMGTPLFMAPEQAAGREIDFRADMYSLGITLFYMVVGIAPYSASSPLAVALKHAQEPLPIPPTLEVFLGGQLSRVLLRMCAKEPGDRYPSYQALIADIDSVLAGGKSAPNPRAAAPPQKSMPWRAIAAGVAAVALLAVAAAFALDLFGKRRQPPPQPLTNSRGAPAKVADAKPLANEPTRVAIPEATPTQSATIPLPETPQAATPSPQPTASNRRPLPLPSGRSRVLVPAAAREVAAELRVGNLEQAQAMVRQRLAEIPGHRPEKKFLRDFESWLGVAIENSKRFGEGNLAERQQSAFSLIADNRASLEDHRQGLLYLTITGAPQAEEAFDLFSRAHPAEAADPLLLFAVNALAAIHDTAQP